MRAVRDEIGTGPMVRVTVHVSWSTKDDQQVVSLRQRRLLEEVALADETASMLAIARCKHMLAYQCSKHGEGNV